VAPDQEIAGYSVKHQNSMGVRRGCGWNRRMSPGRDKTEAPIKHHDTERGAHREIEITARSLPLAGLFRRQERHTADGHGPIRLLVGWEKVSRHPGARIVSRKRW
jgi:hypothetical protein